MIDLVHDDPDHMILVKKKEPECTTNMDCLKQNFRHGVALHFDCMYEITVLTQLAIRNGEPLFDAAF